MSRFKCRHCGRPIAVPASRCPWCDQPIMVICANCKQYTDDQKAHCQHCGAPLKADRMERVTLMASQPDVARLAQDREQAQLVASTVVVSSAAEFFHEGEGGTRTVLVDLLGSSRDPRVVPAGVILVAYAYLERKGYCSLEMTRGAEERVGLERLRPWDGQRSVEGALLANADRALATREATDRTIRDLMGFRVTATQANDIRRPKMVDGSARTALAAIDYAARVTVLPEYDHAQACQVTYRLLLQFVEAGRERAQMLAVETLELLDWFANYRRDPSIRLGR